MASQSYKDDQQKAKDYVFQTKDEWKSVVDKVEDWKYKQRGAKLAFAVGEERKQNVAILEKYAKEADADHAFDPSGNVKRYQEWLNAQLKNNIKPLPGVFIDYYDRVADANPLVLGKKGWIGEEEVAATPENKETAAEAAAVKEINAGLSPEREKELRQKYTLGSLGLDSFHIKLIADETKSQLEIERGVNIQAGRDGTDSDKFRSLQKKYDELRLLQKKLENEEDNAAAAKKASEKITEKKEEEVKQSIDQGKKEEEQRQEQKEEKRQQAIATGAPAEPEKCPCGAKLSDEQKSAINWGRNNSVFQNPVASQINNAQGGFADTLGKINSATALLGTISGAPTGELSKLANTVGNMQGALSSMSNTSNRLSGLPFTGGGPDLLSLVSTVGAAVNFQCALGIEGLDVGAKVGLVTENGKMKLNVAINAQANLSKIMDDIAAKLPGDTGASDALQKAKDAIAGAQAELAKITNELNNIAGDINGAIAEVNGLFNDALDFVTQFTNINFALNFSNDPCTKFGVGFQQGILNPAFIERARAANPLNKAVNPGFGTSTR